MRPRSIFYAIGFVAGWAIAYTAESVDRAKCSFANDTHEEDDQ